MLLLLSPHLDDAVFSLGAYAHQRAGLGEDVLIATVFTASVPEPRDFALACQTDKGYGPEVDYMALRRAEDEAACAIIGAGVEHWGFAEAPHRGYETAAALFEGVREGEEEEGVVGGIAERLREALRQNPTATVCYPCGAGGHVDHLLVIRAVEAVWGRGDVLQTTGLQDPTPRPFYQYYDQPYVARHPERYPELASAKTVGTLTNVTSAPACLDYGLRANRHLGAKLAACAAYASQVGYQFYAALGEARPADADDVQRIGEVLGGREYVVTPT